MHTTVSKDGTFIAYDRIGQGPALILVAGAFSYRKFPGQVHLAEQLAERFTVFNYDRRGRGDSGDTGPYSVEKEIEDLQAIIDAAGGSAYVYGLSSGAVLALRAAARGLNISKLVLHEPPFVVKPEDRRPPKDLGKRVNGLVAEGRRAEAVKVFMTEGMGAPSFVVTMLRWMPVWSQLMALAHTLPYDAALLDGYSEGKPLPTELTNGVSMPALVLEGPESPASLRHAAQALAQALPQGKLVSKKGLGHTKKLNARMVASELMAFL
ncbi:alpha/beta hydrolase [Paenibacillus sp. CC-CFT747]|nr:alpha/beta hydrolase [Paenibacillus sp. CC-CFT747]